MTKETKNTVSAETIVENLKVFAKGLHDASKKAMFYYLLTEDIDGFKTAKTMHSKGKADKVVWFIFDAYAIALIYTVIKILET